jgi:WhiB family transcriptional regulator, redox-sensing transcriptional regulator
MVLKLRQPAPGNWREAKCLEMVDKPFGHPEFVDPFFEGPEADAIEFCRGGIPCPLLERCLSFALVNNEKSGCWGGTGEVDRRAIRKRWPLRRGKDPRPEWDLFEPGEPASWFAPEELVEEEEVGE